LALESHRTFGKLVEDRPMRIAVRVAAASFACVLTAGIAHASPGEEALGARALFVEAFASTGGAYGENWHLTLAPNGEVFLQVSYATSPSGEVMAHFTFSERSIGAIREVCKTQQFFDLPTDIAPLERMGHKPSLQIEIHLAGRHHKASLYDPSALRTHAAANRFLAVWNAVFETLPLRPSW
jgi:hypothetical protein